MATKTRRIEARADEETDALIRKAAGLLRVSTSQFVLDAARERAERLMARADVTYMGEAQFEMLLSALHDAEPMPALEDAAARPRRFTPA